YPCRFLSPRARTPIEWCIRWSRDSHLLNEYRSAIPPARIENNRGAFGLAQLPFLVDELCGGFLLIRQLGAASTEAPARRVGIGHLQQLLIRQPSAFGGEVSLDLTRGRDQYDGALELAFVLVQIGLGFGIQVDSLAADSSVSARRPRPRISHERNELRVDDVGG